MYLSIFIVYCVWAQVPHNPKKIKINKYQAINLGTTVLTKKKPFYIVHAFTHKPHELKNKKNINK